MHNDRVGEVHMKTSSTFHSISVGAFVAGLFVSLVSFSVAAETPVVPSGDTPAAAQEDSRAMLKSETINPAIEQKPNASDFDWGALTKNSGASGSDPVIGEGSGKAYYDFKDGLPHPFYVAPNN